MQIKRANILSEAQVDDAARLFAILSEPSRLRIIRHLMTGPQSVGELVARLDMKQGSVSKQLAILHQARLLTRERNGNFILYGLADPILAPLCKLVCHRIERLARQQAKAAGLRLK
jgi:DNA-binding transcriptional ArsR family regulator